ncbi:alpha/beta fold hydrolase [Kitasatospora sp. NPDC058478]|uniref:alpha/beta fold hydrolase n=1 Tax=unclassified Kitasatospora TaxID=2633591 RepID=UPI00365C5987
MCRKRLLVLRAVDRRVAVEALAAADDVQGPVLPDCGHYPAEEAPQAMLAALTAFLAPYRDGATAEDALTARVGPTTPTREVDSADTASTTVAQPASNARRQASDTDRCDR